MMRGAAKDRSSLVVGVWGKPFTWPSATQVKGIPRWLLLAKCFLEAWGTKAKKPHVRRLHDLDLNQNKVRRAGGTTRIRRDTTIRRLPGTPPGGGENGVRASAAH